MNQIKNSAQKCPYIYINLEICKALLYRYYFPWSSWTSVYIWRFKEVKWLARSHTVNFRQGSLMEILISSDFFFNRSLGCSTNQVCFGGFIHNGNFLLQAQEMSVYVLKWKSNGRYSQSKIRKISHHMLCSSKKLTGIFTASSSQNKWLILTAR